MQIGTEFKTNKKVNIPSCLIFSFKDRSEVYDLVCNIEFNSHYLNEYRLKCKEVRIYNAFGRILDAEELTKNLTQTPNQILKQFLESRYNLNLL